MLKNRAVLVCVNRRLARHMSDCYARFRQLRGDLAWASPDILPYGPWLARIFEDHFHEAHVLKPEQPPPTVIDEFEEELIWEQIISDSDAAPGLFDTQRAAQSARQAWELCRQWKVPIGDGIHWSSPDTAAFARWAAEFKNHCSQSGFMDQAGLAGHMAQQAESAGFGVSELILAGFDELSPVQQDLFSAMESYGVRISQLARPEKKASGQLMEFADDKAELRAAASWARNLAEKQPDARIGVVAINLDAIRDMVLRVFEDIFYPSAPGFSDLPESRIFNISTAPGLSAYPVVAAALEVLGLARRLKADIQTWIRLLGSPFLAGGISEYHFRAVLDSAMRDHDELVFSALRIQGLARSLKKHDKDGLDLGILINILESVQKLAASLPKKQSPDKWSLVFSQFLDAAGWPGQRFLSSHEFQTVDAFRQCLERFAGLSPAVGKLSFSRAIKLFERLIASTLFQPEQADVPVQILGMLEAAGQEFDALWIMGMHHDAWPPSARPNPFIPPAVSRARGLPRCSPERELARARGITGRLLESADSVICSYGRSDGETCRLPSPLISHLKPSSCAETEPAAVYAQQTAGSRIALSPLERLSDIKGAPVVSGADVSGGTGILKSQSACPFQAYGRYRLGGRSPGMPGPGLNARDRGSLVHSALELLWNRLKDSDGLAAMDEKELMAIIEETVSGAVKKLADKMPETFSPGFTRLETDRLRALLAEWMENEKKRAPFAVIATENRMHADMGNIGLWAFADRIDKLKDGRKIIIDYKTGPTSPGDWFTPRLAEPQLPLYSLAIGGQELAGVFFARVKKGQCAYLGIAASDGLAEGIRCVTDDRKVAKDAEDVEDVLKLWREQLSLLAEEIGAGHAAVSPRSVHKTCRYCDLPPLCRIWEVIDHDPEPRGDV